MSATREDSEIVLRIRDNGIGVDPTLLPHIFEMFVQGARGPDRSEGGLGLGLSLVQTLTALHGGTVSALSDGPGRGSEFTLRMPLFVPPTSSSRARAEQRPTGVRARRILVVDDNVDAAEMIAYVLTAAGHEVQVGSDSSQALLLADTFRPQLAILDIGLPVMDGYMLAYELRARQGPAAPILIALTGYGHDQDKRRSNEAGFALHLVKPIDADKLLQALDTLGAESV